MFVRGRRMLVGKLAMFFGRRGVILRVFVFADLMMVGLLDDGDARRRDGERRRSGDAGATDAWAISP